MDSKTVRYGRIGEVVVLIFPDEQGSKHFITHIETQNLLKKMGVQAEKIAVAPMIDRTFQPRQIA
jgi:hypothetical protein